MKTRLLCLLAALLALLGQASPVFAQGTAFTYQGRLQDAAGPPTALTTSSSPCATPSPAAAPWA